ncbi:MAG: GIY-YIG nuclease family protein [Acidobacteria bacterium]|nr:GIY-YIG nuclease family protein [Acidobacteriota bacterium]
MREYRFYVYMMASKSRVLYIGITNNLGRRLWEHKQGLFSGFTRTYKIHRLVYYEVFRYVRNAIDRERHLNGLLRRRKIALIESMNRTWEDLAENWYVDDSSAGSRSFGLAKNARPQDDK